MEKLLQYKDILPKISIYKGFFHFETLSGVSVTDFEMLMTDVTPCLGLLQQQFAATWHFLPLICSIFRLFDILITFSA